MNVIGNSNFTQSNYENSYIPTANLEEYNPEQEPETWENDPNWIQPLDTDTPESPPTFEKEGYVEGVEYHDSVVSSGAADVDHRVLHHPLSAELGKRKKNMYVNSCKKKIVGDIRGRKDVDHRNLISLTGSPADSNRLNPNIWNPSGVDQVKVVFFFFVSCFD